MATSVMASAKQPFQFPKRALLRGVAVIFVIGLLASRAQAQLVVQDFENSIPATGDNLGIPNFQVLQGTAVASSDAAYSGLFSLKIEAGDIPGVVAFSLADPDNASATLFADFRLRPTVAADELTVSAEALGARVAFLGSDMAAELFAYDANNGLGHWRDTGVSGLVGADGSMLDWLRLTFRIDSVAGTWDLYSDGLVVAVNLGLLPAAEPQLSVFGATHGSVYLDDVYLGAKNPLLPDSPDYLTKSTVVNSAGVPSLKFSSQTKAVLANMLAKKLAAANTATTARSKSAAASNGTSSASNSAANPATNALYGKKLVFVHPTIRTCAELGAMLAALTAAAPAEDPDEYAYLEGLTAALKNAPSGNSPSINWKFAASINEALALAQDGTEIVVFPGQDPYVLANFDPQEKQVSLRCLEGVVLSTPEAIDEAKSIQSQKRADILTVLSTLPEFRDRLSSAWPTTSQINSQK